MKVLLISADPAVRQQMGLAARSVRRSAGEPVELFEAENGVAGVAAAWRLAPQVVVVDEIMSRAGAFAVARDLKGSIPPFEGAIVILLERSQDEWLARWSGADAWFVKPVDPFRLADTVAGFLTRSAKEAV